MNLLSSLLEGRSINYALDRAAVDAEVKKITTKIPSEALLLEMFGKTYHGDIQQIDAASLSNNEQSQNS